MTLRLYDPEKQAQRSKAIWRVNGFPAYITIWTPEEWSKLEQKPSDAQLVDGFWVVLRMVE